MIKYISIFLLMCFFCTGCFSTNTQSPLMPQKEEVIQILDPNSLKTNEITYRIQDKSKIPVYDEGDKKTIQFNENWFVVHKDLLKTMNENQDYLIQTLKKNENGFYIPKLVGVVLVSIVALMLVYCILSIITSIIKSIFKKK